MSQSRNIELCIVSIRQTESQLGRMGKGHAVAVPGKAFVLFAVLILFRKSVFIFSVHWPVISEYMSMADRGRDPGKPTTMWFLGPTDRLIELVSD